MFIVLTIGILLLTAAVLLILRFALPDFRFAWLTATGGALLAWISIFVWQTGLPIILQLPIWQPQNILLKKTVKSRLNTSQFFP